MIKKPIASETPSGYWRATRGFGIYDAQGKPARSVIRNSSRSIGIWHPYNKHPPNMNQASCVLNLNPKPFCIRPMRTAGYY